MSLRILLACLGCLCAQPALAQPAAYGPEMQGFAYPFPQQRFALRSQGQDLSMAFMDVAPARPNGRTVVLIHGKNFCGATWEYTIRRLTDAGYRVIAPDQIGFCASSKPKGYQFSFNQLAANTNALLKQRGVVKAVIIGHSMGGMLAARYALMYPAQTERLVMVNPLGLEDWQAEGAGSVSLDEGYANELKTTPESIKAYQMRFYYNGQWKPEYDRWVTMLYGLYAGPGKEAFAMNMAQTSEMIFFQPVVHQFPKITVPTTLFIGGLDKTAPGANRAPSAVAARLGNFVELGRKTAAAIPGAKLVEFADLGHSPQVEAPERFHDALVAALVQ